MIRAILFLLLLTSCIDSSDYTYLTIDKVLSCSNGTNSLINDYSDLPKCRVVLSNSLRVTLPAPLAVGDNVRCILDPEIVNKPYCRLYEGYKK